MAFNPMQVVVVPADFSSPTDLALVPVEAPERPSDFEEQLNSLALRLQVPSFPNFEELQQGVFEGVLVACKEKKWSIIQENKDFLTYLTDRLGRTLLMAATSLWDAETVQQLIQYRIGIHRKDIEDNTTLHVAAKSGALDLLPLLLKHLKVDELNRHQQTPLHVAIFSGQHEAVRVLLSKGANVNVGFPLTKSLSITSPSWAVMRGEIHCLDLIIEGRGSRLLTTRTPGLGSFLHLSTIFHQPEMLKHLFFKYPAEMKGLLEESNEEGLTPFSLAARYGFVEALILFKEQGANVETKDPQGNRPLHQAVLGGQHEIIDWLLYLGCNVNGLNFAGHTPAALAEKIAMKSISSESQSIANLLQTYSQQSQVFEKPEWFVTRYENLVFQGGGTKGICYLGSLRYLEEVGALQQIRRVAGTSAGAITSALIAVNYSSKEIQASLLEKDLSSFLDHPLKSHRVDSPAAHAAVQMLYKFYQGAKKIISPIQMVEDLIHVTGLCEGSDFLDWIEDKIFRKTNIRHCTFKDLRMLVGKNQAKHLHIYAIKIGSKPEIVHFSSEETRWDDLVISDAIRCSMSIPAVFKPHILHFRDSEGNRYPRPDLGTYIDGGVLYNFPIEAFDRKEFQQAEFLSEEEKHIQKFNTATLGFSLYSSQQERVEDKPVETVGDLIASISSLYYNSEETIRNAISYNAQRVVPLDFQTTTTLTLKITPEEAERLIDDAYKATRSKLEPKLSSSRDRRFFLTS